ncbi:MAG: hypothetical protein EOP36_18075 [Rubrivivax sp.]|nr:MAG: hypothetical protein EOP36_18075 [Rubrivivax sp.]
MTRLNPRDAMTYADVLVGLQEDAPEDRLALLLKLRCRLSKDEWWPLLGLVWYACNRIGDTRLKLKTALREAEPEDLRMMMSAPSAAAWDALPPEFTVYRGCSAVTRPGLSWSMSRAVAEAYAHQHLDEDPTGTPLVMTGAVNKRFCVLMLDRGEAEVVAWEVWRVGQEVLRLASTEHASKPTPS